jgi:HSP20 family protein
MLTLRSAMDRLFDNTMMGGQTEWQSGGWSLALDVSESADEYTVKASLPGMDADDLDVTFTNGVLTIKGEIAEEEEKEGSRWHLHERRWGTFSRSVQLPNNVNGDAIQASYDAGVLTLHLPKVEEARPRKIQIGHGEKMLEGTMSEKK